MKITVLLGALLCALFATQADARSKHGHHYGHHVWEARAKVWDGSLAGSGCSDPVMRPCGVGSGFGYPRSGSQSRRGTLSADASRRLPTPAGLSRVMAEGAGRAVNWARPRAWCGYWMRRQFGVANPAGNLARWWAGFGRPALGPHVGAIVVWRHHVGRITGRTADGRWIVKSGNDGHRVRERPRSVAGAIAFRWPA